jgi:hypothetical protein
MITRALRFLGFKKTALPFSIGLAIGGAGEAIEMIIASGPLDKILRMLHCSVLQYSST